MAVLMQTPNCVREKTLREHIQNMERVTAEYQKISGQAVGPDVLPGFASPMSIRVCQPRSGSMCNLQRQSLRAMTFLSCELSTTNWNVARISEPPSPTCEFYLQVLVANGN